MLLSQIYPGHESYFESRSLGRSLQQHILILVMEPWWLPIKRRAPNNLLFISMAFQLILNIYLAQPERSWNVGYSWSRVFLPCASGCTGGFFTQLLFHNPHSFSPIEAINSIAFFLVFVCHSCSNKCSPTLCLVDFSGSWVSGILVAVFSRSCVWWI